MQYGNVRSSTLRPSPRRRGHFKILTIMLMYARCSTNEQEHLQDGSWQIQDMHLERSSCISITR